MRRIKLLSGLNERFLIITTKLDITFATGLTNFDV